MGWERSHLWPCTTLHLGTPLGRLALEIGAPRESSAPHHRQRVRIDHHGRRTVQTLRRNAAFTKHVHVFCVG
jgi:hypothetical protein